jgi:hypothetical protein
MFQFLACSVKPNIACLTKSTERQNTWFLCKGWRTITAANSPGVRS